MGINIVSGHFILQGNIRSSVPHMKAHNCKSPDNEDLNNKDSQNNFQQVKISHHFRLSSYRRALPPKV